ncbi:MAG: hypothetical protein L6V95_15325 [Candidatus Melainabacteria bacterium]|nr:MAG: hypothetical protein L6V95_15325 [Candidatus Melainabacteria bacterium]
MENMIDDIEINGEFQLVGLTLDNTLKDLDSKKYFQNVTNMMITMKDILQIKKL